MPKTKNLSCRKTVGDSAFSFEDLDSAWPSYKHSPISSSGRNKKLNLLISSMTYKCTFISHIITALHVSTLSCHRQKACN